MKLKDKLASYQIKEDKDAKMSPRHDAMSKLLKRLNDDREKNGYAKIPLGRFLDLTRGMDLDYTLRICEQSNNFGMTFWVEQKKHLTKKPTGRIIKSPNKKTMEYSKTPPKNDIGKAMAFKEESIGKFQKSKENSIIMASSGRDATMIVSAYSGLYKDLTEEELKKKIKEWRDWFYNSVYNTPFI